MDVDVLGATSKTYVDKVVEAAVDGQVGPWIREQLNIGQVTYLPPSAHCIKTL